MLRRPPDVPDEVWSAVQSVEAMPRLRGLRYEEIPVPAAMCDYGIGVAMERVADWRDGLGGPAVDGMPDDWSRDAARSHGWIMTLYRDGLQAPWVSHWRCVAFMSVPLEGDRRDALTIELYRDMLRRAFADGWFGDAFAADPGSVSGTVSVVKNTGFGRMDTPIPAACEIRASWTPMSHDAGSRVRGWGELMLCATDDHGVDGHDGAGVTTDDCEVRI